MVANKQQGNFSSPIPPWNVIVLNAILEPSYTMEQSWEWNPF
jgi:hypothetical protein